MKNHLQFVWLILLMLVSACVETAHAPEVEVEATSLPTPTATLPANTAVIFKRSGGIAGLNEQWTIFSNGHVETNSASPPQLTPEQVSQLLDSLEMAGFYDLENDYLPEDSCCDRFFYEITALEQTDYHTVRTVEATPDMPEPLQQSLRLVQNLLFENNNQ